MAGAISRTGLGGALNVRLATVTEICRDLIGEGMLEESGKRTNPRGVGKNETLLAVKGSGRYFIGCELFPESIAVKTLDLAAGCLGGETVGFRGKDAGGILEAVSDAVENEIERLKIPKSRIYGLGFVDPGIIDVERGYSVSSTIMPVWKNVPTKSFLSQKLNMEVFMIGTSQARALAEYLFGCGKGVSNFVFIEYSKGIACGIVSEGKLVRGRNELAGEFGHFRFAGSDRLCRCGRMGCLEAIASSPAAEQKAREMMDLPSAALLKKLAGADRKKIDIRLIIKAASKGDPASAEILSQVRSHIAMAAANLVHILDPAKIVFDSAFLVYGKNFMQEMFALITRDVIFPGKIIFEVSGLDSLQGALGGAGLALQEFLGLGITHV